MRAWMIALGVLLCGCGGSAASGSSDGTRPLTAGLEAGGGLGTFGVREVGASIPAIEVDVAAGTAVDAGDLGLGGDCGGWVAYQPDYILRTTAPVSRARFSVTPRAGEELTLIVYAPDQQWHCADEGAAPTVEVRGAPAGQYDVWIGRAAAPAPGGPEARGTLRITD